MRETCWQEQKNSKKTKQEKRFLRIDTTKIFSEHFIFHSRFPQIKQSL